MDMKANKKKLGLKEKYAHMTRGLDWETSYQPQEKVFPQATFEGIKLHDWDKWEDPFRLTMDSYWKYQAEKERKLYDVLDAFAQNRPVGDADGSTARRRWRHPRRFCSDASQRPRAQALV